MTGIIDYLPTADDLLELPPEDLGPILLELIQKKGAGNVTTSEFVTPLFNANCAGYPYSKKQEISNAVDEAWQWLVHENLVIVASDQPNGYFRLTRKGAELKNPVDIEAYRYGNILPIDLLHPTIARRARPIFLRGSYDDAVLHAFRVVEMEVRRAAGLSDSFIGRKLMQTAFGESGPLSAGLREKGEQVGLMELFAGAIGFCKNPGSHRSPGFERLEAAQLLALASYLLSQVEEAELMKPAASP